jgi:lipopolysaccharide transport system permease protein
MDSAPLVHIRRGARWRGFGFGDVWAYRGLLLSLGVRDIKLRYKQTLLGVVWVVMQPLLSAGIMTIVFGYIAAVPGPAGVPYFVFAYLGQMAWSLFSLTVARTSGSMIGSMALVMKVYFPRPILPLATIFAVLLDFVISFMLAVPMVILYGSGGINVPIALVAGVSLMLAATGIGFLLAAVSVRFRDVLFVLPLILQLGLYASPVAYGVDVARDNLTRYSPDYFTAYMLNPLASLIEAFRWSLLAHGTVLPGFFAYSVFASVALFVCGFAVFRASEGKFADVI